MSFSQDRSTERRGFCTAPWTDCIMYANGELKACDRNIATFGNWQKNGLKKTWHSEEFQNFRQAITEGRYPNEDCASCHNNGTQRTAVSSLGGAFVFHYKFLERHLQRYFHDLTRIYVLMKYKHKKSPESDEYFKNYFECLDRLQKENAEDFEINKDFHNAIVKLRVIGECLQDHLDGSLLPRRVAPFRQSQLQAKCTARCVMCVGKYTGEIVDGPTMESEYVDEAFHAAEDIVDFWCNGAEFFYYPDWKKVSLMLAEEGGTKLRVSTNGILLTDPTIRFMVDNNILRFLTFSFDAATKETMENTRINVNYEKSVERIRYLLHYATSNNYSFEFVAAFVLMKRNLHELPDFIRLIAAQRPANCVPQITVLCQPLENFMVPDYRRFVHKEHHSLLGEERLKEIFTAVYQAHLETGVRVNFYNQGIAEFIKNGMVLPRYFAREMDEEIFFTRQPSGKLYLHELLAEKHAALEHRHLDQDQRLAELLSHPIVGEVAKISPKTVKELMRTMADSIALSPHTA